LYKAQLTDLREDFEEKRRQNQELEEERNELTRQLQMAIGRADAESLAKSIAHETIAELEKEKTMKELEIKDLTARHKTDCTNKDTALATVSSFTKLTYCTAIYNFQFVYLASGERSRIQKDDRTTKKRKRRNQSEAKIPSRRYLK